MKKISSLRTAAGPSWHLAVMSPEGEGAVLLRVAAWAVESVQGEDDRVVALVVDPETEAASSAALRSYDEGDDAVVGLVEPGQEVNGCWNEVANERALERRKADDEAGVADAVKRLAALTTPGGAELLRSMRAASRNDVEMLTAGDARAELLALAEHGLVATHRWSSGDLRHTWIVTPLGDRVLRAIDALRR